MNQKIWDAEAYGQSCAFVYRYGAQVTELLHLKPGTRLLDIGCGNGALTAQLAEKLAPLHGQVVGIDASPQMLSQARQRYPHLDLRQMDATGLTFANEFDAVFSNAVFHWITQKAGQQKLLAGIEAALRPGGELVFEMGGAGCAGQIHRALGEAFARRGMDYPFPFYFPTIGEYAPLVEAAGLTVTDAMLFDRPTRMEGPDGLVRWIRMFVTQAFEGVPEETACQILEEARQALEPALFDGRDWTIDYVRLRLRAEKRR